MNRKLVCRAGVCSALIFGVTALFAAQDLPSFSGYTRPGWPNDSKSGGEIRLVADEPDLRDTAIGGTVFFSVLQLNGKTGDSWNSGLPKFNTSFMPGILSDGTSSPALDINARYLYLYQVVNDRRTPTPIGNASVKLIVEPPDVTSWGHFDGVGFAVPLRTDKVASGGEIRPVSYTNVLFGGVLDRIYKSPAEYVLPARPLVLTRVPTKLGEEAPTDKDDQRVVRVVWDALDPALNPNHVMLLHISDFNQMPCIRAVWSTDNGIKKDMRSTVFGFTSNWPPTYEPVRLRGLQTVKPGTDIKPAADKGPFKEEPGQMDESDGRLGAVGTVPTPKPERPFVGADAGAKGGDKGFTPALTNYSGAGQTAPAAGAAGAAVPQNGGAGNGGGGGSPAIPSGTGNSGTRTVVVGQNASTLTQQGSQSQTIDFSPIIINEEGQNQLQNQFQQQQQQQQQSNTNINTNINTNTNNGGGGVPNEVVPTPAGFLLAALGLPVLLVLLIRRRATPDAA
jgi:hypothetical protein